MFFLGQLNFNNGFKKSTEFMPIMVSIGLGRFDSVNRHTHLKDVHGDKSCTLRGVRI